MRRRTRRSTNEPMTTAKKTTKAPRKTAAKAPRKTPKTTEQRSIPVGQIVTLKRNPQYLTPRQMDSLKESIRRDGFCAPILVRPITRGRFEVISGNHRFMAASEVGMREVPCVVARMTKAQAQRLAVNLNTIHGDPNAELLAPFLAEMDDEVLRTIHVEDRMKRDLAKLDEDLAQRMKEFDMLESMNQPGPHDPPNTCECPKCGRRHRVRKG